MKKLSALALLGVSTTLPLSAMAANELPKPYGSLAARVIEQGDKDVTTEGYEARLGLKGLYTLDEIKVIYQLEVDFVNSIDNGDDDEDEITVRRARLILPSRYGSLVVAPRTESGQQKDLYGPIDIFETNEMHGANDDSDRNLFRQAELSRNALAYITPFWGHTRGVVSMLTLNDSNDEDIDVWAWRVVYDDTRLHLGGGQVRYRSSIAAGHDYVRSAISAGYDFDPLHLGLTYEDNDDDPAGDSGVLGVVASYAFSPEWRLGLGYIDKNFDDGAREDEDGMVASLTFQPHDQLEFFVETGQFSDNSAAVDRDNVSAGIKFSF